MKHRRKRIKLWFFLLIMTITMATYLYLNRQSAVAPSVPGETVSAESLIYKSESPAGDIIKNYNFKTSKTEELFNSPEIGQIISLTPGKEARQGVLLHLVNGKFMLSTIECESGKISNLADVSAYAPTKVYQINDGNFTIIGGEKKKTITIIDSKYQKILSFDHNEEITAIGKNSNLYYLSFADFNGSNSNIYSYSTEDSKSQQTLLLPGLVYQFDEQSVMYAKKINLKSDDPANPAGQTYWKIAVFDQKEQSENIISEGNSDQNAVSDHNFKFYAYQKKLDTSDQADGRIFIINAENDTDRLDTGTPLLIF